MTIPNDYNEGCTFDRKCDHCHQNKTVQPRIDGSICCTVVWKYREAKLMDQFSTIQKLRSKELYRDE